MEFARRPARHRALSARAHSGVARALSRSDSHDARDSRVAHMVFGKAISQRNGPSSFTGQVATPFAPLPIRRDVVSVQRPELGKFSASRSRNAPRRFAIRARRGAAGFTRYLRAGGTAVRRIHYRFAFFESAVTAAIATEGRRYHRPASRRR